MGVVRFMNTYLSLKDKHEGERCFIFGAGPFLWFHMGESYFSNIHKAGKTIVVNSAVLADPNFDYWISNDALCRRWSWWEDVKKGKGIKIVRNSWEKYRDELDGFLFFDPRPTPEHIVSPGDVGLSYCSSVPSAIDLAIQMGFKKIFLLGVDHYGSNELHHFWQMFPKKEQPSQLKPAQGNFSQQKKVFPINIKAYKALKKFADYKSVEIYNCDWPSEVEVFERMEIDELREIIER